MNDQNFKYLSPSKFDLHYIFCENPRIIFVLFYDVHKENMFTINLEDGRDLRLERRARSALNF